MKIDRLLAEVLLLLHRRKVTAQELSERFQVSVRTVYRDIDTIDAAGIPIVAHQGQGGGFSIVDSYRLEKQLLSPDEIMTMLSVLAGVGTALGDARVIGSRKKIESLVPREKAVGLLDEVRVELSAWAYRGGQDTLLETVRKAVQRRRIIRFLYRNSEGKSRERSVEPMTLVFKGSSWYLFGYCRFREDFRMFRLSRMRGLLATEEGFERRPEGYDRFVQRQEQAVVPTASCEIRFAAKTRFAAEDMFDPAHISPHPDGSVTVKAELPVSDWVVGWLLSFADGVTVIRPARLRERLKSAATDIAALYED